MKVAVIVNILANFLLLYFRSTSGVFVSQFQLRERDEPIFESAWPWRSSGSTRRRKQQRRLLLAVPTVQQNERKQCLRNFRTTQKQQQHCRQRRHQKRDVVWKGRKSCWNVGNVAENDDFVARRHRLRRDRVGAALRRSEVYQRQKRFQHSEQKEKERKTISLFKRSQFGCEGVVVASRRKRIERRWGQFAF